jgi:DNA-binding CsgD family transcriptional regulator
MGSSLPQLPFDLTEAALNPDLWTIVFHWLLLHSDDSEAELTLYRQTAEEPQRTAVAVKVRQGPNVPPEHAVIATDGAGLKAPVIEFRADNQLFGVAATGAEAENRLLRQKIVELKDEIARAVRVNCALLSPQVSLGGMRAVLGRLKDPAFKLTLDGAVAWQNEAASAERWRPVFSTGLGKPLTLHQDDGRAALRSALADLASAPDLPARHFPVAIPEHAHGAIMAVKGVQPAPPFSSVWVELFKPAPEAIVVLRTWDSKPNLSPSAIRQLYGLTAKEADLAIAMAHGESLKDYAERKGVSHETARWHSKRVMQKMDCGKQQDVMFALLYRNALFCILD